MYTDDDLEEAVNEGIFTDSSVKGFREYILTRNNTHAADEENFRLIGSFNDIFVLIACALLLLSSGWVTFKIHPAFATIVVSALSWGLAEFFVLKRKMALPAIALLISFVGGIFAAVVLLFEKPSEISFLLAASVASAGAWFHWRRFRVPITVAAGAATMMVFIVVLFISLFPDLKDYLMFLIFLGGIVIFALAMRWDASDLKRVSWKSDVAFWLHLASAPLILHPVFSIFGVLGGNESVASVVAISFLYILLTLISLVIDRRAFMVSSLVYVLVALARLLETYGFASDSFAYVGVFIGFSLLLLSGFWHKARRKLVAYLPESIQQRVPFVT